MLGRRDFKVGLLVGLVCLLVYNANGRAISSGDTYPARYLPFALWHHGTLRLDPIEPLVAQGRGTDAYWIVRKDQGGHATSLYPVTTPVLLAPLYLPAVAYLNHRGWTDARLDYLARLMEKLCASSMAALSVALLYLLLRRRTSERIALLLAAAYALGTTTWVISSQALWQHGLSQLLVTGTLLLLTGACSTWRAIAAGLLCGLLASNRPPDALLAAALGGYGLFWAGRRLAPLLVVAGALPAGLTLAYNLALVHCAGGAYGVQGERTFLQHPLFEGLAGLLVSPMRGLFVYSPFLLFLALALARRHRPRELGERRLTLAMTTGVALQLLLYAKSDWRGGLSWGPRYMTDMLPLLMWMLVPMVASLQGLGRAGFHLAVAAAMVIQGIGAFWYTGQSDQALMANNGRHKLRPAWDWRNAGFIAAFQHGPAPAELTVNVRGTFDAVEQDGRPTSVVTAGQEVVASGWTLAGHRRPFQVAVMVDGRQPLATGTFVDRPDVHRTLGEGSPCGWRIPIDTTYLAPGEHRLSVLGWASPRHEPRYLGERRLTVRPAEVNLVEAASTAETRIRAHQDGAGYWLTAHTTGTRFESPGVEMNTFVTALLVDLLSPLPPGAGLGDSLARARRHLTDQIEASGLVRYHGRPEGPGIGRLGCAITPDTDDTALVWRIAGEGARRAAALATIERYRTAEGLYRTWLAPRQDYQCLDPGDDPNPADLTIQVHLLLLLAQANPPAARALCAALQPVVNQGRVWVYYKLAPLVPTLRLPDLRRAGCELKLPASRMRTSVPGQEAWVSIVAWLAGAPGDAAEIQTVLRVLAQNDFALLRKDPPLLYHNDLTASVSRYYWSEDVGYALWRRLYEDHAANHH